MEQFPTSTTADQLQSTSTEKLKHSTSNRNNYLASLYSRGGFIIACETVITLHKITSDASKWEIVGYGILAILAKGTELSIFVGDVHSGELKHEFSLSTSSKYSLQKDHFHTFLSAEGDFCGLSFVDTCVAQKIFRVVSQLMPKGEQVEAPPAKRHKHNGDYDDWVVINSEDVPKILDSSGEVSEKGVDEPDFSFFKKEKKKFTVDDISGPSYFRRTSLGGTEEVSKPVVSGASVKQEEKLESQETGTIRSSSFTAFEATAPIETTTPATSEVVETSTEPVSGAHDVSSASELGSRSSFTSMSSYTSSNFSLPEPPESVGSHDTLLYQINTFDRRRMHHVTEEEVSETKSHEESQPTMLSILQKGFSSMLPRLQAMCPTVATVSSSGEEDGFDDFDGQLFE